MDGHATQPLLDALERMLLSMPPVRALQLRIAAFDGETLTLAAPLAANVNDKGSAFGGSLASAMTLAAWGLPTLELQSAGFAAEVYVQDSTLRYLKPLYEDLQVQARLAPDQTWRDFVAAFGSLARMERRYRAYLREVVQDQVKQHRPTGGKKR